MAKRNILDYQGNVIGELELPDGTPEDVWAEELAPYALTPPEQQVVVIEKTLQDRKEFCISLLEEFKTKNVIEGIGAPQGLWLHHRLRALPVTYQGVAMTIDLLNITLSGDIELGTLALMNTAPDDMSQTYHWLSAERLGWLIGKLIAYLGWS